MVRFIINMVTVALNINILDGSCVLVLLDLNAAVRYNSKEYASSHQLTTSHVEN